MKIAFSLNEESVSEESCDSTVMDIKCDITRRWQVIMKVWKEEWRIVEWLMDLIWSEWIDEIISSGVWKRRVNDSTTYILCTSSGNDRHWTQRLGLVSTHSSMGWQDEWKCESGSCESHTTSGGRQSHQLN